MWPPRRFAAGTAAICKGGTMKGEVVRKIYVVTVIPWLWLAAAAMGQSHSINEKALKLKKPVPTPTAQSSAQSLSQTKEGIQDGGTVASSQKTPLWATYSFFFWHLGQLDQMADEQEALGNAEAAKAWRTYEQLASGLDAREGEVLRRVARRCVQALAAKDAEIQAAVGAIRAQHPKGDLATVAVPAELQALWDERVQIVQERIDHLRALLGEERFQVLDHYVQTSFVPTVKPATAGGETQGGVQ